MHKLLNAISLASEVERLIYMNEGELTPATEKLANAAYRELSESVEAIAFAYKNRQTELEYLKKAYRAHREKRQGALEQFKQALTMALTRHGKKFKTPLASISLVKRKTESVVILDFDTVAENYKDCIQIFTDDNERKIVLNKAKLKNIYKEKKGAVNGFDILTGEAQYPLVSVDGWQSDIALDHIPE